MSVLWKHGRWLKNAEMTKHCSIVQHHMQKCHPQRLHRNIAPRVNSELLEKFPEMANQLKNIVPDLKGGYLDFLHLTELRNIHITEIYVKKTVRFTNN